MPITHPLRKTTARAFAAVAGTALTLAAFAMFAASSPAEAQDSAPNNAGPQYVAIEGAVTNFQVRQTQDADRNDQITVTFSDGSADATTHEVVQSTQWTPEVTVATLPAGQGDYSYVLESPENRRPYIFEVVSTMADGTTVSAGTITFSTNASRPPAPKLARVAAYRTANVVVWHHADFEDASAFRNTGQYRVYRQTVNTDGTTSKAEVVFSRQPHFYHHARYNAGVSRGNPGPYFTDQDVTPGVTYRYHVSVMGSNQESFASNVAQVEAMPNLDGTAPENITYFRDTEQVTIEWTNDAAFAFDHFVVETRTGQDEPEEHRVEATGPQAAFSHELPGARAGYRFRVRGVSALLGTLADPNADPDTPQGQSIPFESNWSESVAAERLPRPSQPTGVSAEVRRDGNLVSWNAPEETPERARSPPGPSTAAAPQAPRHRA